VVCSGSNDSNLDPVLWVPTGETVKDVDVLSCVEVIDSSFTVDLESVLAVYVSTYPGAWYTVLGQRGNSLHLDVDGTPPDIVLTSILKDDSLVFWRTTGLLSGEVDQSTTGRDDGAFVDDGVFVKRSDGCVSLFRQLQLNLSRSHDSP
jgi:hypothetical protein